MSHGVKSLAPNVACVISGSSNEGSWNNTSLDSLKPSKRNQIHTISWGRHDAQHNDTQYNNKKQELCITTLDAEYCYSDCCYDEYFRGVLLCWVFLCLVLLFWVFYAKCKCYAECFYATCCYAKFVMLIDMYFIVMLRVMFCIVMLGIAILSVVFFIVKLSIVFLMPLKWLSLWVVILFVTVLSIVHLTKKYS